jgi:hypothetical protein
MSERTESSLSVSWSASRRGEGHEGMRKVSSA